VLTDPSILKVLHSAQADEECLWTAYGSLAAPIFDTSIAASLLGMGDQIGLGRLLEDTVNVTIEKGHSRTNWLRRPLPAELVAYAREDVAHLVAAYWKLRERLAHHNRLNWAMELSAKWTKSECFTPNFIDMAARVGRRKRMDVKALSLLVRLMEWRDRVAVTLNIPRRRVADDQALIDIAITRPSAPEHLHSFRGMHRATMATHTDELLTLCRNISVIPGLSVVRTEKVRESLDERLAIELFQYVIKILAQKNRLSARHLLDRDTAEKILFGKFADSGGWVTAGLISQDIHSMIGNALWAFVTGQMHLSLEGGKICLQSGKPKPA
jgi:ribonuclease D